MLEINRKKKWIFISCQLYLVKILNLWLPPAILTDELNIIFFVFSVSIYTETHTKINKGYSVYGDIVITLYISRTVATTNYMLSTFMLS